jgi:hypothetical protein
MGRYFLGKKLDKQFFADSVDGVNGVLVCFMVNPGQIFQSRLLTGGHHRIADAGM